MTRTLQRYWRLSRGLTMGAQGLVMDADLRILLVRMSYKKGWHFPGGGVERNEKPRDTVMREVEEETGVMPRGEPEFFGLYANFHSFPSDHVAFFLIRDWHRPTVPAANREIVETGFFARDALPAGTTGAVLRRLAEVFDGTPRSSDW